MPGIIAQFLNRKTISLVGSYLTLAQQECRVITQLLEVMDRKDEPVSLGEHATMLAQIAQLEKARATLDDHIGSTCALGKLAEAVAVFRDRRQFSEELLDWFLLHQLARSGALPDEADVPQSRRAEYESYRGVQEVFDTTAGLLASQSGAAR